MAKKDESKNKEYVVNFRVSRETYDKITDTAKKHGKTISGLVRDVFEDGSDIMSDLSEELFGKKDPKQKVVSYHEAVLVKDIKCSDCKKDLKKGSKVQVGETVRGRRHYFCSSCAMANKK